MNTDDEDPDWDALAKNAEAWEKISACIRKINRQEEFELSVTLLQPGTRLVVTTFSETDSPVDFSLLDPASCKVLVKDGTNFTEHTEGTLLGCEHFKTSLHKRVFLKGKLKMFWWLTYEVGGKTFGKDQNTIKQIQVFNPGSDDPTFTFWSDL